MIGGAITAAATGLLIISGTENLYNSRLLFGILREEMLGIKVYVVSLCLLEIAICDFCD